MRDRLIRGVLGCLTLALAACATSAIEDEDSGVDTSEPADDQVDAGDFDASAPVVRDASVRDAGRTDGGGAATDAGNLLDGGGSGSKDAAVKDAAVIDAGGPPRVDAGQPVTDAGAPPLMCTGNTTTNCNGQCVDLRSDSSNCGNCGHACGAPETCTNSACTTPTQQSPVPAGCTAMTYGGHTYAFCNQTRSWDDARRSCLSSNLDLTIVTDMAESNFVKGNGESWIGEDDQAQEGKYVAVVPGSANDVSGAAVTFFNWSANNPDNSKYCDGINIFVGCLGAQSDEDCLMIGNDGTWNDDLCTRSKKYVCESY